MPSISDIPWLRPARTLPAIEAGAAAGARRAALETSAAEASRRDAARAQEEAQQAAQGAARLQAEQQRTQSEMTQAKMRLDAQTKLQQQQSIKQAQQLQIEGARKDAQFGLQQQRLKQLSDAAQQKSQEAAKNFAARDKYSKLIEGGMPPDKAIFQVPELMTPGVITATMKPPPKITEAQQFADSPVMQGEEQAAEKDIQSGVPELKAIQDHPTLIQNPPYSQRWGPRYNAALARDAAAKARAEKPPKAGANTATLASRRAALSTHLQDPGLPPETKKAYKKEILKIDTELNGGKPPDPSPADIAHLKSNPDLKDAFDENFGEGSADKILKAEPPAEEAPAAAPETPDPNAGLQEDDERRDIGT